MRGDYVNFREQEKSNSDISALSALGPSMDRVNNRTHNKFDKEESTGGMFQMINKESSHNGLFTTN